MSAPEQIPGFVALDELESYVGALFEATHELVEALRDRDGEGFQVIQDLVDEQAELNLSAGRQRELGATAIGDQVAIDPNGVLATGPEVEQMMETGNRSDAYQNGQR